MRKSTTPETARKRKRKPAPVRRLEIEHKAGELFAAHGFSVSTRTISDALGITQAALYKHYRSKDELVEAVLSARFLDERPADFSAVLNASEGELGTRLAVAYNGFFSGISETSLKLFQRAAYDGLEIAQRYSDPLDERILMPVLTHLRADLNLPTLQDRPASRDERELALMLHSSIVFLAMRKHVYHIDFQGSEPDRIAQYVTTWLHGARMMMRSYHPC